MNDTARREPSTRMHAARPSRGMRIAAKIVVTLALLAGFAALIWTSDRITLQGERTIYTVRCADGEWQGRHCTGRLAPAERYTFRTSRSRQEVLYWIYGSSAPSGKYTECRVENRGNWACRPKDGEPKTITHEMKNDHPVHVTDGSALQFHAVPKWKWWAVRYGLAKFSDAGM